MSKSKTVKRQIEIMDTTLRDGEQTQGVSISAEEKFTVAKTLLERVKVDRIEVASAKVSEGEKKAVSMITSWAKTSNMLERVEVLGFCDINKSADWVGEAGGKVINLLTKGSYKHLTEQLKKTPAQHIKDILKTVEYCNKYSIECNCYPEAWSSGMLEKNSYALDFIKELATLPLKRIMLADTLGILSPDLTREFVSALVQKYPNTHFDFHAHNDYGLATANTLTAARSGVRGVHVTVNGLGERTGNASLDEVCVSLKDLGSLSHNVAEKELVGVSNMVEVFSGRRIAPNKPICGSAVFTQTAGIHADGDKKGNLYVTRLSPERFKRTRTYALGKLAGKASLDINLDKLGISLTPEQKSLVLNRVIELGDNKRTITVEDLPFIISDVLSTPEEEVFAIEEALITTTSRIPSSAVVKVRYNGVEYSANATGDGGYDAFMKAVREVLEDRIGLNIPKLLDYEVHIPPGGRTDALVETTIKWENSITTRGVDSDQVKAAIAATENMLNIFLRSKSVKGRTKAKAKSKK